MRLLTAAVLLLGVIVTGVRADDVPFEFDSPEQQQRYTALIEELRCLVCQNQSLADSHADLAQDLRDEVFRLLQEGHDNETVIAFLVDRYGDFVLYKPPMKRTTWLLWLGPFLLLAAAGTVVVVVARRRQPAPAELSEQERERLAALLAQRQETP